MHAYCETFSSQGVGEELVTADVHYARARLILRSELFWIQKTITKMDKYIRTARQSISQSLIGRTHYIAVSLRLFF